MRLFAVLVALALAGCERADGGAVSENRAVEAKPGLAVLTSLPIFFANDFSVEPVASPLRDVLEDKWSLKLLSTSNADGLEGEEVALLLHPPVQTAEALVDLDEWVRGGGRLLLLADPLLEWPSELPLGDPRAPPPFFMDTGLLAHWGVRLHGPEEDVDDAALMAPGRGRLEVTSEDCAKADDAASGLENFIVHCRLGEGHALIIADVDMANPVVNEGRGTRFLLDQLARLAAL